MLENSDKIMFSETPLNILGNHTQNYFITGRPVNTTGEIKNLTDLEYSIDVSNKIRLQNLNIKDVITLLQYGRVRSFKLYGNSDRYGSEFVTLLSAKANISKRKIEYRNRDKAVDNVLRTVQDDLKISDAWKHGKWKSELYGKMLKMCIKNEQQLTISSARIKIKYYDNYYKTLPLSECITSKDWKHQYSYDVTISGNTIKDVSERGLTFLFDAFELRAVELCVSYHSITIRKSNLDQLKAQYCKFIGKINPQHVCVKPHNVLKFVAHYNFVAVLNEINWTKYISVSDCINLLHAYNDLRHKIKEPYKYPKSKSEINKDAAMVIEFLDNDFAESTALQFNYKYDVTVFKTVFNGVNYSELMSIIDAAHNIGQVVFDHRNLKFHSAGILERFKSQVYEFRAHNLLRNNPSATILMEPVDFYERDKRTNLALILNEVRLENVFPANDILSLYEAYEELIESNSFRKTLVLWKCLNSRPLTHLYILCRDSWVKLVGNDNFQFQFAAKDNEHQIEILEKVLELFGHQIYKIRLTIMNSALSDDGVAELIWFRHIRDVTYLNSKNMKSFTVASAQFTIPHEEDLKMKTITLLTENCNELDLENELDLLHELDIRDDIITELDLRTTSGQGITGRAFEKILKLPKLNTLKMQLTYPTISNWKFLETITCGHYEKLLPELEMICLENRSGSEHINDIEPFLESLLAVYVPPTEVQQVELSNWNISPKTFNSEIFRSKNEKSIKCTNCTFEENLFHHNEFEILQLAFIDMEVPLKLLKNEPNFVTKLVLKNCPNITNGGLEMILANQSLLKNLSIDNCPISDDAFYNLMSSTIEGTADMHVSLFKMNIKFKLQNLSQCSPRVIDFVTDVKEITNVNNVFPRIIKMESYIEIRHHPELEHWYSPKDMPTYVETFGTNLVARSFGYWNQKYGANFSNVTFRVDYGYMQLIGNNRFIINLGPYAAEVDRQLLNIFQCFGENMRTITILINNNYMERFSLSKMLSKPEVIHLINYKIEPYCQNVNEIKYGLNLRKTRTLLSAPVSKMIKECPLLQRICYREHGQEYFEVDESIVDADSLMHELQEKEFAITILNLADMASVVTEKTFQIILKLPWLTELFVSASSYPNISGWSFLKDINTTAIFQRLQIFRITQSDETQTEDFLKHLKTLLKVPWNIIKASFRKCKITHDTCQNYCFVPRVLKFSSCTVPSDVCLLNFSNFSRLELLQFKNMEVPPSFLCHNSEFDSGFYLELEGCLNVTDKVLKLILTSNPAIKFAVVRRCPVSEIFFTINPHLHGDVFDTVYLSDSEYESDFDSDYDYDDESESDSDVQSLMYS